MLLAAPLEGQPGGAAGVVVDQAGKPVPGVHVHLMAVDFRSNGGGIDVAYGATSDTAGKFSAEGLKPGIYIVMAERAGFIQAPAASSSAGFATLALKPGQHLTDYKISMTARALIAGRVVDEYGDPVQQVSVEVEPVPPDKPEVSFFGPSGASTDDRGEFRLITAPGRYYVAATFARRAGRPTMTPAEIRTDGTSGAPFATTYYPSAANTNAASVVQVGAGQDVAGVEIRLVREGVSGPARGLTVSGMVTGAPDDRRGTNVMLSFGEEAGQLFNSRTMVTAADGKFSFPGLQPGYYRAMAFLGSGSTALQSRAVEFQLAGDDPTDLQLSLAPGEDLTGRLELVGGDGPADAPEKRTVLLEAADGFHPMGQRGSPAAEVGKDGSFTLNNVMPGKFRPVVEPMPENGYVKEIALDGKAAPNNVLDLSQGAGGARLKITVSRAGGQISGRVLDKDGEPAMGMIMVIFASDPKHMDENDANRVSDGKYSFKAIRPGKYRLFALDILELAQASGADGDDDKMMEQFFDAAEEIEIKEGDRISKDIPAWTKAPEKKEAHAP
jgi:protocatechuate 3,4-dioxygenase beta subunit